MRFQTVAFLSLVGCSGRMNVDPFGSGSLFNADGGTVVSSDGGTAPVQMTHCPKSPDSRAEVIACGLPKDAQLFSIDSEAGVPRYWILEGNGITRFSAKETKNLVPMKDGPGNSLPTTDLNALAHYVGRVNDVLVYSHLGDFGDAVHLWNGVAQNAYVTTLGSAFLTCNMVMCAFSSDKDPAGPTFIGFFSASGTPSKLTYQSNVPAPDAPAAKVIAVSGYAQVAAGAAIMVRDAPQVEPANSPKYTYAIAYAANQSEVALGSTYDCSPETGGMKTLSDLVANSTSDNSAAYVIANAPSCIGGPNVKIDGNHYIARIGFDRDGIFYFEGTAESKFIRAFNGYLYGVNGKTLRRSVANMTTAQPVTVLEGLDNLGPAATDGNSTFVTFDVVEGQTTTRVLARVK